MKQIKLTKANLEKLVANPPPPLDFWFQGNYQFENDRQGLGFLLEHLYGFACALSVVELYREYPKWRARRKQE